MPEQIEQSVEVNGIGRHRGRLFQIRIYLVKFLRMFIYQNDWKVLPMAAAIGVIVAMVTRSNMFVTMEGTLVGSFAITLACVWNGCFNSIQVVCRERGIVKREHRSGMHISSYVCAHVIYQALLCLAQTILLMIVCVRAGVPFPKEGFITRWIYLDIGISAFLITFASDMMGLLVSSFVRTTTAAMTVMPLLLVFQLIFSGGMVALPQWTLSVSGATLSRYGLRSIAALADFNSLPAVSGWNTLSNMRNTEIDHTLTVDDVVVLLQNDAVRSQLSEISTPDGLTMEQVADTILETGMLQQFEGTEYDLHIKLGDILNAIGEQRVKEYVTEASRITSYNAAYEHTRGNVIRCWMVMIAFSLGFVILATIALEFIDKDKR